MYGKYFNSFLIHKQTYAKNSRRKLFIYFTEAHAIEIKDNIDHKIAKKNN